MNVKQHFITACWLCCGVAAALTACDQKQAAPADSYTVSGTAEGTQDGDTVYLCEMQGFFGMNPIDSAYIKDGRFEFKGKTEGATLCFLVPLHGGEPTTMQGFILENAAITARLGTEKIPSHFESGPNGKLFEKFMEGDSAWNAQIEQPWKIANDSAVDEATKQRAQQTLDSLQKLQNAYHKKFIVDHVPSAISDFLFSYCMNTLSDTDKEELLKLFGEKQPQYPVYKAIMAEREAGKATAIGAQYTDLAMPDPDGKEIRVSDYVSKNKYTLIDFWASWCGPCRAEMPTVVKAYSTYHAKGFEVVGVSFDNDKAAWLKAIDQLKMPWPQMSDLKGWESVGAEKYNVRAIPANVLIDQQGKIVAKDLRGEDLLSKLGELMK